MTDESATPEEPEDDPEVEALLNFTPVERRCRRADGWPPEIQRGFVRALVLRGSPSQAANDVGRTKSGAYEVRIAAGGESFAAAWDGALALYHRRNPRSGPKGRPSRGEILSGAGRTPWPGAPPPAPAPDPEAQERAQEEALDQLLLKYITKVSLERSARLSGRIVEADFYVRQLSWFEVAIDLGGGGPDLLKRLRRGALHPGKIVATPMSLLLAQARRLVWEKMGEPERPPEPELGRHDDEAATGPPLECQRTDPHLGDSEWRRRQQEKEALAAEAQAAWEEKARREAEAWRRRVEGEDQA
jgi:hypothetical protein